MKLLFFILFFQVGQILACSCNTQELLSRASRADFIASAKIESIKPDPDNSEYHILQIQILELYKGQNIQKIKLHSHLNSSCAMLIEEDSLWLIFADKNKDGALSFGRCSGSNQLDRKFDEEKYPGLMEGYAKRMMAKQLMLAEAKEVLIDSDIYYSWTVRNNWRPEFKDWYLKENSVGFYELVIDENFKVMQVISVKGFDDSKHNEKFLESLKRNISLYSFSRNENIQRRTSLIIGFYYGKRGKGKSSYIQQLSTL